MMRIICNAVLSHTHTKGDELLRRRMPGSMVGCLSMGIQKRCPVNGRATGFPNVFYCSLGGHDAQKTPTAFSDVVLFRPGGAAHDVERLRRNNRYEYHAYNHDERRNRRQGWYLGG